MNGDWMLDEAARFDPLRQQTINPMLRQADGSGDLGSGVYTQTGDDGLTDAWEKVSQSQGEKTDTAAVLPANPEATMQNTKEVAASITREQAEQGAWLWPRGGVSRDGRFQVVVRAGVDPVLSVNGKAVAKAQLGEQVVNKRERAQVVTWYGVALDEGENTLTVSTRDMFGNERVMAEKPWCARRRRSPSPWKRNPIRCRRTVGAQPWACAFVSMMPKATRRWAATL